MASIHSKIVQDARYKREDRYKHLVISVGKASESAAHALAQYSTTQLGPFRKTLGINLATISEGLGHAKLCTTQIYLDSLPDNTVDDASAQITAM